jgi:hypothetical protein
MLELLGGEVQSRFGPGNMGFDFVGHLLWRELQGRRYVPIPDADVM